MSYSDELEQRSIYIIREAAARFKNIGVLISMGKDSITMAYLIRLAFPKDAIPENIHFYHLDTGLKFQEMYEFRDKISNEWNLKIEPIQYEDYILSSNPANTFECCNKRKTLTLKRLIKEKKIDAIMTAIRRDEMAERGIERVFSPRKDGNWEVMTEKTPSESKEGDSPFNYLQDAELSGWNIFASDYGSECDHLRVHPILDWTERDVWDYVKLKNLPVSELYFSVNGKRFRSLGCETCTHPINSEAKTIDDIIEELKTTEIAERSGRSLDKEKIQMRLRSLGYL
jgi:sulfate adenylyltransferase subunit 2